MWSPGPSKQQKEGCGVPQEWSSPHRCHMNHNDNQRGRHRRLKALFAPRSIAVIGASASPAKLGSVMLRSLASFPGALYPIHPRETVIGGYTAYPRVTDVPGTVDLAILAISASAILGALQDCAAAGVQAAIICSGGFAEAGKAGQALQNQVTALLRETGMRLLGPNTSGFVNPEAFVRASFVPGVAAIRSGSLAVVAQSGGVNHALAFLAHNDGLGLRLGVGLGNAIDIGFADVLDYLADDEETRVIVLHIEGVADGRALFEAIERVIEHTPVVTLKVGRADVGDFARSHTGALTGNWALTRAALAQAGAVVVEDMLELVDAAQALACVRLPPATSPGVAVVTSQAGPGLLITDLLRSSGVAVPSLSPETQAHLGRLLPPLTLQSNPVDTGRPDASFGKVLATVGADPAIAGIIAYALHEPDTLNPVAAVNTSQAQTNTEGQGSPPPVVFATGGPSEELVTQTAALQAMGVPVYTSPERGARAMRALVTDARAAARRGTRQQEAAPLGATADRLGPDPLDEDAAKTLLEDLGIRTPRRRACRRREEARAALAELSTASGRPVVVKVLDAAITHKSDVGGVHLGITSPEALEKALDAIDRLTLGRQPRYLLEEMLPSGLELIVGGKRDVSFGPTVLVGLGGVLAEVLGDVALRLAPLTSADAAQMLDELAGRALLDGYRGQPGVNREELVKVLLAVSRLLLAHPEVAELDINPLRATSAGLYALDALVILES